MTDRSADQVTIAAAEKTQYHHVAERSNILKIWCGG